MIDRLDFHHVGYACADLASESSRLAVLGYEIEGDDFTDQTQGVKGRFLIGGGPRLELLSNLPDSDTLQGLLKNGTKMYHLGYWASDLERDVENLRSRQAKVIVPPVKSRYFETRICFLALRNGLVVELIERQL